jgi:hypothetical protein
MRVRNAGKTGSLGIKFCILTITLGRSRKDPYSPPTEEISAVRRRRGEKLFLIIVNVLGVDFPFPPWGWYGCFLE